jgi:2,4-dienoyl-CoA reductase-like NADH-dependent reductase (Old Yellow Enzyme family)
MKNNHHIKTVFEPTNLGGMYLKNRIFRSATRFGLADADGRVTREMLNAYERLAIGGVGTIITGHSYVTDIEKSKMPYQKGIYDDSFIEEYQELTSMVHKYDTNIIMQLNCVGSQTVAVNAGKLIWGPSAVADSVSKIKPKEMVVEEILFLQDAFGDAALRVKKAGFDGVQIHAAHGYVLSKFLSPYYNRRQDEYGGTIENRAKMVLETYSAIRRKVGQDYPVIIKLNCEDYMLQGFTFEDCRYVCHQLTEMGIDAIEISGGNNSSISNMGPIRKIVPGEEPYFLTSAADIALDVDVPIILVGGIRDVASMENILNHTYIRYFSLSRPLLCESDLVKRWQSGNQIRAKCTSCCKCTGLERTVCILNAVA